ncbi:MAG: molecular chaperone TorD family protein [Candidatus Thiodiazotropha sp.]
MRPASQLKIHNLMLSRPGTDSLDQLSGLAEHHPWLQLGIEELSKTSLAQWQREFTRLFLDARPMTIAPPFESVYRHQQMQGPVVERLSALYRAAGLDDQGPAPDFLGTQLQFAAYLDESTDPRAQAWRERLWQDHLLDWLPGFVSDLCEHSRLLIYRLWGGQLSLLAAAKQRELAPA